MKVLTIGGGPAATTLGSIIKRYRPSIDVLILEREKFPRDHVGGSLLPVVGAVLDEMGCWNKVEAANFPIKIGATYRWGPTDDLWDMSFLPFGEFQEEPRPGRNLGQRSRMAWHVDRAVYDEILVNHARELGCRVHEEAKVIEVLRAGDQVVGVRLEDGTIETADFYVDCSGSSGTLRRAMEVEIESPTTLQNVAFYDTFEGADLPMHPGKSSTRTQIMSLGYGWLWSIPISETRSSCGLVVPVEYFKASGKKPEELFLEAIKAEPRIAKLLASATRENQFHTTKDFSFLAERLTGENWALCGDSAGFADPILSAGLTLTHTGARQLAYILIAMDRKNQDINWLKQFYNNSLRTRIRQHIRLADFWYASNGQTGLELSADDAFQRVAADGFAVDNMIVPQVGEYTISAIKWISQKFTGKDVTWAIGTNNVFRLDLEGAKREKVPIMQDGRVIVQDCYVRNDKMLPITGLYELMLRVMRVETRPEGINNALTEALEVNPEAAMIFHMCLHILESWIAEGWVKASFKEGVALLPYKTEVESDGFHSNRDGAG